MGRVGDQDGHEGRCRPREKLGIAAKMGKKKEKKAYRETDNSRDPDVQPSDPRGPRPAALPAVLPPANTTSKRAGSVLQKMREKLQGGHFRWINEQLYTTAGDDALTLMNQSPELYAQYHEGRCPISLYMYILCCVLPKRKHAGLIFLCFRFP